MIPVIKTRPDVSPEQKFVSAIIACVLYETVRLVIRKKKAPKA